jgi:hypothetical protein
MPASQSEISTSERLAHQILCDFPSKLSIPSDADHSLAMDKHLLTQRFTGNSPARMIESDTLSRESFYALTSAHPEYRDLVDRTAG